MKFTDQLWSSIDVIFSAILDHKFIRGLCDGSLDIESFKFYIVQDALYLREFARALSITAAKSPNEDWIAMFNEHSVGALRVERALHESFFKDFNLSRDQVYSTPLAPTNLAYTSYLLSVAYCSPFHEILGAIMPCYWIYNEVGKHLAKSGSPNELYQRWIETYSGDEFEEIVRAVLQVADKVSMSIGDEEKSMMARHFITTSRYEWMFWNMGYIRETWPFE